MTSEPLEEGKNIPPYPLHPSILPLLDPEYHSFYNIHLLHTQVVHHQPISISRGNGILLPGAGPQLPVGSIQDFAVSRKESEGPDVMVRCFVPAGEMPEDGWAVMVYYHGGGWVLGNIATENVVCTHLCVRGNCVIVSVDYRYVLFLTSCFPFPRN